jgi:DNA invertase Pin-like site-specific DNA recombinase
MEAGLDFVALDNEHANKFTLHVLAAVAEQEARATSERTKAALAAAKRRGVLLGSSRPGHWQGKEAKRLAGSRRGVRRAAELRTQAARQHNGMAVAEALRLRREGKSWLEVAAELNARGLVTRRGNAWSKSSVFMAVRAAAGCMMVAEATADVLAGLSGQFSSFSTAVETALT